MSGRPRLWPPIALLIMALAGCAAQAFPIHPPVAPPAAIAPSAPADAAEPLVLPPPVDENRTFVTIDGNAHYRIGPGDVLDVVLTKELALDRVSATVKPNGKVSIGFFEATVSGLTVEQAAGEIERVLAPTHRRLTVEVVVREHASKAVSVLGEVQRLGVFPLKGKTNLVDLLAEAGGFTANADPRAIRLLRREGDSYTINLYRLVAEGQRFRELVLDTGDVVFVPSRAPDEQRKVFVLGEVKSPGVYPFTPNVRLSQVLAMAGGPTATAVLESVRVVRGDLKSPQIVEVYASSFTATPDRSQDIVLQTNDLVVVPRSRIGDWNAFLAQLRPTLEFLTLPLQSVSNYFLLREVIK
jgi:protein involved in polysaccharide export with SLBB domain